MPGPPASNQGFFQYVMPFSAIVGQVALKEALLMLAVNPRLAGILVRGEKGTAKSTAVRGFARLLPKVPIVEGCRFGCRVDHPQAWCWECRERIEWQSVDTYPRFETLPLGVTEDQLLGTIDLEQALEHGLKRFEPGLLARANNGILYVDEINLLEDHLVDLLLDVATTGVNVVAREGVTLAHPADFLLVGTMNPEEGELRPQLIDRFGLCVEISSLSELEARVDVVERALAFEADPTGFNRDFEPQEQAIVQRIVRARELLRDIEPRRSWSRVVAELSLRLDVHGHRADVFTVKGAMALAALNGRKEITRSDIERAALLAYPHRLRRDPFEQSHLTQDELQREIRTLIDDIVGEKKKPLT